MLLIYISSSTLSSPKEDIIYTLQLVVKSLKVRGLGRSYYSFFKDYGGFPQLRQCSHDNDKNTLKGPNYLLSIYAYLLPNYLVP